MMLQIGDWTVEPALNQLSVAGETVNLEPKAMAVLVYLAERPGQVVSRTTLLATIWPDLVVSDDSLTQVVIKLRKALGDAPAKSTYIQTISKGGYRLVAPVMRSAAMNPAPISLAWKSRTIDRKRRAVLLAATAISALLVAGAGAWWFNGGSLPSDQQSEASTEATLAAQLNVAIRPFEALGTDRQVVLLARGMTDDLVLDLSKVSGLSIIRAKPLDDEATGAARADTSSIDYVVAGTVQRADQRLRIQIYLTEARTSKQLWAERFDRPVSDLFSIQQELAPKILQILPAKINQAVLQRIAKRHTYNLEAYETFQRGQAALLVRQRTDNEVAREMFRRAIELDPAFARAYAGLALTYAADYRNQWSGDGDAALKRAFELARTAHQINPDLPETYWTLAFVNVERRQHEEALQYLKSAIQINPSYADAYALMGGIDTYLGQPANTVILLRTAMRLNPQAGSLYFLLLGRAYLFLGDFEQARFNLEQALSRNQEHLETHVYMAVLHVMTGEKEAAAWEAEEIRLLQPTFNSRQWLTSYPMTDAVQKMQLIQALNSLAL